MAKEEFVAMSDAPHDLDGSKPLVVRRGRVESVDLYEIKDSELDLLEKGTPAELQFNFSIFLLSAAFSAIAALSTATFANKTIEIIFIVVSVVGIVVGIYLMIAWSRTKSAVKMLCKRIRERIPPDALYGIAALSDTIAPLTEDEDVGPGP